MSDYQNSHSVWLQGAKAARDGAKITDCPYHPIRYEFVVWINGWAATTHEMMKEGL